MDVKRFIHRITTKGQWFGTNRGGMEAIILGKFDSPRASYTVVDAGSPAAELDEDQILLSFVNLLLAAQDTGKIDGSITPLYDLY